METREKVLDWLADTKRDEVRQLVQAAGLPVSRTGGAWVPVAELRKALGKHLAPEAMRAPEALVWERMMISFLCVQLLILV